MCQLCQAFRGASCESWASCASCASAATCASSASCATYVRRDVVGTHVPVAPRVCAQDATYLMRGMSRTTRGPLGSCGGGRKRDVRTYVRTHSAALPFPLCSDRGGDGTSATARGQRRSARCMRRGWLESSSPGPEAISQVPGEFGLAPALEPTWVRSLLSLSMPALVAIAFRSSLAIPLHLFAENVR